MIKRKIKKIRRRTRSLWPNHFINLTEFIMKVLPDPTTFEIRAVGSGVVFPNSHLEGDFKMQVSMLNGNLTDMIFGLKIHIPSEFISTSSSVADTIEKRKHQ
jgi:hypothetical protein